MENTQVALRENLKPVTMEEKIKRFNSMAEPDGTVSDIVNREITIHGITVTSDERTDPKTGVINEFTTIALFTDIGTYMSNSLILLRELKRLSDSFGGPEEWTFRIVIKRKSAGERQIYYIVLV